MEKSKRERVGGGKAVLLHPVPNLAPSPLFSSSLFFKLIFSNYLKACYRLTTCIPSFSTVYGIYSTWTLNTFGALLLISRNGFGSTNFSTALRLRNCHCFFFLVFFLLFFLRQFMCIFLLYFLLLSPVSPTPCSRQEGMTICFAPDHSFDYSCFLGLPKKYWLFCSLIDVLVSMKL